ncbi:hypothetical protein G7Y79_00003g011150 [Physcia stellaris]|nr:hypothetical protein G7Y79_00003g011150 [Physcia stellaris]
MSSIPPLPSNFGPFDPSRDIGLFNPSLPCPDSETRQFNDVTSFLRNLEHCQGLYRYRRTKLLEYMLWALNGPAWEWYKKQTHFNSLPRFGMALTKAFPSQEQRELEAMTQKRAKRKARKAAERAELNGIETAKQTPTLQDLGIFDPSLASDRPEFGLYSNVATFLQHLEQCQRLYRKSDLLNLLPKCLCGHASDWFKTQSEFTSLKRFSRAITKAFPKTSVRRALPSSSDLQLSTLDVIPESTERSTTCRHCGETFNSKESLREHKRVQHRRKPIESSLLSINTLNSMCEDEEKSSATHVPPAPPAEPQNSISEPAATSRPVPPPERSDLSLPALETEPKSAEKSATCRHCKQTFNSKKMLRQHKREQHAKRPAVSSHLSIDAAKSACESVEISTVNSSPSASLAVQPDTLPLPASLGTFNPSRPHQDLEKRRFNQATTFIQHLQQCQHLCCESELLEWMEVILCGPADTWFENQSNFTSLHDFSIALTKAFPPNTQTPLQDEKKSVFDGSPASPEPQASIATPKQKSESAMTSEAVASLEDSHLPSHTPETVSEPEENRSTQSSSAPPESAPPQTFESEHQGISIQKTAISSPLRSHASKPVCRAEEKSAAKDVTALPASQELQTPAQKDTETTSQTDSSKRSNLLITTPEITSEYAESASVPPTETAGAAEATKSSIAGIRAQAARIRVRIEAERAALQLSALEPAPKFVERPRFNRLLALEFADVASRASTPITSFTSIYVNIMLESRPKALISEPLHVKPRRNQQLNARLLRSLRLPPLQHHEVRYLWRK